MLLKCLWQYLFLILFGKSANTSHQTLQFNQKLGFIFNFGPVTSFLRQQSITSVSLMWNIGFNLDNSEIHVDARYAVLFQYLKELAVQFSNHAELFFLDDKSKIPIGKLAVCVCAFVCVCALVFLCVNMCEYVCCGCMVRRVSVSIPVSLGLDSFVLKGGITVTQCHSLSNFNFRWTRFPAGCS